MKYLISTFKSNASSIKFLKFILPVSIIFSSLKIYGYVFFFVFYIPYIFIKRDSIFISIKNSNLSQRLVFIYFIYLLFSIFYGSYFISDIRIIFYWIPLIFVIGGIYFKNLFDLNKNKFYRDNYTEIIYISSLYYFLFYFLMNIFSAAYYGDFHSIQDYLWIGSSSAFALSSLLLIGLFKIWEKNNFKLYSKNYLVYLFFMFLISLNESRVGLVFLIIFSIFFLIRKFQLKQFISLLTFLVISFSSYTLFASAIGNFTNNFTIRNVKGHNKRTIIYDAKNIFHSEDNRKDELSRGFYKFLDYPTINKIVGSGWYSSRITIGIDSKELKNSRINYENYSVNYLQGIIALLLDTGIIGISFNLLLFSLTIISNFSSKDNLFNNFFKISMLTATLLCLFVGYPLVNIAFVLSILPNGINNFKN